MQHELINLAEFPSMPVPLSSKDAGEAWVWGDYVLSLQKEPGKVGEMMNAMMGKPAVGPTPLSYPYAMTVYYRKDRNPHGPSSRPIYVLTLEKVDYGLANKLLKGKMGDLTLPVDESNTVVRCAFHAGGRYNMGPFDETLTLENVRAYFFSQVDEMVSPEGDPQHIGPIMAIHGHPLTGWPAQAAPPKKGCMLSIAAMAVVLLLAVSAAVAAF